MKISLQIGKLNYREIREAFIDGTRFVPLNPADRRSSSQQRKQPAREENGSEYKQDYANGSQIRLHFIAYQLC